MKINNKEYTVEELRLIKAELDKNPSILKNKSRFFSPKDGDTCYIEDGNFQFRERSEICDKVVSCGVYATQQEAELARDRQRALVRLWNNADEKYYFRPDWSEPEEEKWEIYFDHEREEFCVAMSTTKHTKQFYFDHPFFRTREECMEFLVSNKSDLYLYCLGVKK